VKRVAIVAAFLLVAAGAFLGTAELWARSVFRRYEAFLEAEVARERARVAAERLPVFGEALEANAAEAYRSLLDIPEEDLASTEPTTTARVLDVVRAGTHAAHCDWRPYELDPQARPLRYLALGNVAYVVGEEVAAAMKENDHRREATAWMDMLRLALDLGRGAGVLDSDAPTRTAALALEGLATLIPRASDDALLAAISRTLEQYGEPFPWLVDDDRFSRLFWISSYVPECPLYRSRHPLPAKTPWEALRRRFQAARDLQLVEAKYVQSNIALRSRDPAEVERALEALHDRRWARTIRERRAGCEAVYAKMRALRATLAKRLAERKGG
jgi:hypothetical protein